MAVSYPRDKFLKTTRSFLFKTAVFTVTCIAIGSHFTKIAALYAAERPATWAAKIEKGELQNFFCVSSNLYRGAQPTKEGMAALQAMGIKTVVNLRGFHSDRKKVGKLEVDREHFRFNTWHAEDEDVIGFLKVATDTNRWPIFVHCQHGSDRTGLMCAMYRMAVQGWSREEAIKEMTQGGYGFHWEWQNLLHYLRNVDIEKIRRAAGIKSPSPSSAAPRK